MSWSPEFIWPISDDAGAKYKTAAFEFLASLTTEEFLMCEDVFNLPTASPLQRAICRVTDGIDLGDLWDDENVRAAFGHLRPELFGKPPKELNVLAGIRGGKTLLAAAIVARRSILADLTNVREGETARAGICSPSTSLSSACYEYTSAAMKDSKVLKEILLKSPPARKGGSITPSIRVYNPLYHRAVDIMILAAVRGGASGVSRWQCAFVVDEAARMIADLTEGVTNYVDVRAAVIHRIRPGGVFVAITSPWAATGPIYENSKKVGRSTTVVVDEQTQQKMNPLVVVRAPAYWMNPVHWTPQVVAESKAIAIASGDYNSYLMDVEAKFVSTDEQFFSLEDIEESMSHGGPRNTQETEVPPMAGATHFLVIDAASRKNTFALAVARHVLNKRCVVSYREWTGTPEEPLDLEAVMYEVCQIAKRYEQPEILADMWSFDALNVLARREGCWLRSYDVSASERTQRMTTVALGMRHKIVELPNLPQLRDDFLAIRRLQTRAGPVAELGRKGSRHADGAGVCVVALSELGEFTFTPPHELSPEEARQKEEKEWFLKAHERDKRDERMVDRYNMEVDRSLNEVDGGGLSDAIIHEALRSDRW